MSTYVDKKLDNWWQTVLEDMTKEPGFEKALVELERIWPVISRASVRAVIPKLPGLFSLLLVKTATRKR